MNEAACQGSLALNLPISSFRKDWNQDVEIRFLRKTAFSFHRAEVYASRRVLNQFTVDAKELCKQAPAGAASFAEETLLHSYDYRQCVA